MEIGRYFVGGLLLFGVVAGLLVASSPALRNLPIPALIWPLIVALVADLALMPLVRDGRVHPITMEQRAIGVIGSGLIITGILALA